MSSPFIPEVHKIWFFLHNLHRHSHRPWRCGLPGLAVAYPCGKPMFFAAKRARPRPRPSRRRSGRQLV